MIKDGEKPTDDQGKVVETTRTEKPKYSCKDLFYEYSLLMWDGLGFFGFDDTKIARLRGAKVTFWTPFTSKKQTVLLIISLIVTIYIIITEAKKFGTLKSQ